LSLQDLVGLPYRKGARGPLEFDCAGIVLEVMGRLGFVGVTLKPDKWREIGKEVTCARLPGDVALSRSDDETLGVSVLVESSPPLFMTAFPDRGVSFVGARALSAGVVAVYRWQP
jgi:hypothetical protein